MAVFEGTVQEFMRFTGSYWRIKVSHITRKHKQAVGQCESCHTTSKTLEAAHVHGKERVLIISNLLSHFVEGERVKVDLKAFEALFQLAHEPIHKTIKILCTDCHRQYDRLTALPETINNEPEADVDDYEAKEAQLVDELVKTQSLSKDKAIHLINQHSNAELTKQNTIFANPLIGRPYWWLEPRNKKFAQDLHILLHYPATDTVFHFKLPANSIKEPSAVFKQRHEKEASTIYIPLSDSQFADENGFNFRPFLVEEVRF